MTPPAVISWSFNGIPVQTSSIHRVLPHGDLLVQRVNEDSIGKYKCSAMNPVTKQIAKAGAKLTIADGRLMGFFILVLYQLLKFSNLACTILSSLILA